ncbi:hypothetical protein PSC71_08310 [Devosia sp. J2-20]|uniref:VpaChn25_0724 family phage protein n=1 Tax=Devosia sp. J2-20 TaxID=3026161 RepID=UPI00249A7D36|nr:hypothetical protein [Devosia sp. J2-20]WDR00736.1 hypothetical protein PSC71_08310 [Devosia sp. J2-20]
MPPIDRSALVLANIRLIILRALAEEDNESLNDTILQVVLEQFGYSRSRDFIANELTWLEKEVGAVRTSHAGSAIIATLVDPGRDHVTRRRVLHGVQKPSKALDD